MCTNSECNMKKNVTLSAEQDLLKKARMKASRLNTTINREFRNWLRSYARSEEAQPDYNQVMELMDYVRVGNKFTRDEMNER